METCPFCKSDVPDGASVCAACGAHKGPAVDTLKGVPLMGCFTLFVGVGWFFYGPFYLYLIYFTKMHTTMKEKIYMQLFAWAVTIGGVWLFRKIMRRLSRQVWLRGQ
jgi:hypothetical protein